MIFTIAFFIIAIIRCLFWFQFFSNFRKVPINTSASGKLPGVSLIVVVKNEYLHLQKLVPALLSQKYANFEIIIVDDFSTDESFAYLKSFEDQRLNVIKCDKDLPGKKYALSQAIDKANNELILLTDGDCLPASEEWIQKMVTSMTTQTEIVLGFGMMEKKGHLAGLLSRYDSLFTATLYGSAANLGLPYMGVGRNLLYSKSLYKHVGGYEKHADLPSGDDDLQIQLMANNTNTTICLDEKALTYTEPKASFKEWVKQKMRHISVATAYKNNIKNYLIFYALMHLGFIYLGIFATYFYPLYTLAIFAIFYIMTLPVNFKNYKKLGEEKLAYFFPLADITFAFINPLLLMLAQTSTPGKWK